MLKAKLAAHSAFDVMEIDMLLQSHQLAYANGTLTFRSLTLARKLAAEKASTLSIMLLVNTIIYEPYISRKNKMHIMFQILDQHAKTPVQFPGKEDSELKNDEKEYDTS